MHDLYKYDLYVSYFITFSLKKLFFGCLRKITFLGYGCDPDLGEPLMNLFFIPNKWDTQGPGVAG